MTSEDTGGHVQIGASTWIWTSPLTDAALAELAPRLVDLGFDVLELPVEQLDDVDATAAAELLDDLGLGVAVCAAMAPGRDLSSTDPQVRESTRDYLRGVVDVAETVGATTVAGPMYTPTGDTPRYDPVQREAVLGRVADGLGPVAEHAAERGVSLAIEPLNRYETSLCNTVEQTLELCARVDVAGDVVGLTLDTFHLNIEDPDVPAAVRAAGDRIRHVQACGVDRGAPRAVGFDWVGFRDALAEEGYDGPWCIESFTPDNEAIARAASIWRPLEPSQDAIATVGLGFLRELTSPG